MFSLFWLQGAFGSALSFPCSQHRCRAIRRLGRILQTSLAEESPSYREGRARKIYHRHRAHGLQVERAEREDRKESATSATLGHRLRRLSRVSAYHRHMVCRSSVLWSISWIRSSPGLRRSRQVVPTKTRTGNRV